VSIRAFVGPSEGKLSGTYLAWTRSSAKILGVRL
jgi:hypothetical protein